MADAYYSQAVLISGYVQGIGFRPFIYGLASSLELVGHVENVQGQISIYLEGSKAQLRRFHEGLSNTPPKASIKEIRISEQKIDHLSHLRFEIIPSSNRSDNLAAADPIPLDYGICPQCTDELFDSSNHRHRYPFISCTQCGPRASIITTLPFDRQNTRYAKFDLCENCQEEYGNPTDRRFHAQTIACAKCGPGLRLLDRDQSEIKGDIFKSLYTAINAGKIVAIKGIGGFHLVCNARDPAAIKRLRELKSRPHKPLAVMGLNTASFGPVIVQSSEQESLFNSATAPIVLTPKATRCDAFFPGIAPDSPNIGIIRPYTAAYLLLFEAAAKQQTAYEPTSWLTDSLEFYIAVTSANLSGEPLITDDEECINKLGKHIDLILLNNLEITQGLDDSVIQTGHPLSLLRLARSYAPLLIDSSAKEASVLACGAYLKNTFCFTQGRHRWVSPHMGDLNSRAQCLHYRDAIHNVIDAHNLAPQIVACDLNPDFYSTLLAQEIAQKRNIPLLKIQHHHAHIAAVLAEHNLEPNCIALALDGFGLGENNGLWGGELFHVDQMKFERVGHLSELSLPGGEKAIKQPPRIANALAGELSLSCDFTHTPVPPIPEGNSTSLLALKGNFNKIQSQPITSSAGRWFDAFSALLGFTQEQSFEGQAAMYLEAMASHAVVEIAPSHILKTDSDVLELRPLFTVLSRERDRARAAKIFHIELIEGLAAWLHRIAKQHREDTIVCSGGCFQNRILREGLNKRLQSMGLRAYFPERTPANDAGISLGQAYIAQYKLKRDRIN